MAQVAIEINNLSKWFGDFQALKNVNLTTMQGEIVVICGPSGSGKSTLVRCINRLEKHQQGTIIVDGIELTGNSESCFLRVNLSSCAADNTSPSHTKAAALSW